MRKKMNVFMDTQEVPVDVESQCMYFFDSEKKFSNFPKTETDTQIFCVLCCLCGTSLVLTSGKN